MKDSMTRRDVLKTTATAAVMSAVMSQAATRLAGNTPHRTADERSPQDGAAPWYRRKLVGTYSRADIFS